MLIVVNIVDVLAQVRGQDDLPVVHLWDEENEIIFSTVPSWLFMGKAIDY